jgi:hypothetical protein
VVEQNAGSIHEILKFYTWHHLENHGNRCLSVVYDNDGYDDDTNLQVAEEEALGDDSSSYQMPLASAAPKSKIVLIEGDGLLDVLLNQFHELNPYNFDDEYSDDSSLYYEEQENNALTTLRITWPARQRSKEMISNVGANDGQHLISNVGANDGQHSISTFHSLNMTRNHGINQVHT